MPFDALFLTDELRESVSASAWVDAMLEVERALCRASAAAGVIATAPALELAIDPEELAREARRSATPAEPLARRLRELSPDAHYGATSQDVVDTAMALVAQRAGALVRVELDGLAAECARLAEEHRGSVLAGRTLLQQATPTTFGLKAAGWLVSIVEARELPALPVQLGGASGTLAAFGERGLDVRGRLAAELGLPEPELTWHASRVPVARLGSALALAAGACAKIALDVQLLAQTEVAEVRDPHGGPSSTMPHKRNPVGPTLARACAATVQAATGVVLHGVHEHERAAGAWQAEWKAVSDALAYTGGAAWWMRETLAGLEVDAERMRANIRPETLAEAQRFGGAERPEDYLGSADELIDRALALYRRRA